MTKPEQFTFAEYDDSLIALKISDWFQQYGANRTPEYIRKLENNEISEEDQIYNEIEIKIDLTKPQFNEDVKNKDFKDLKFYQDILKLIDFYMSMQIRFPKNFTQVEKA